MGSLLLAVVSLVLFRHSFRRDRRRLRNGFLLVSAGWWLLMAVGEFQAYVAPGVGFIWLLVVALLPLSVVVLAGFLIANGLTMLRKEGRSLGNLLSLLAGAAILALPVIAVLLIMTRRPIPVALAGLLFVVAAYVGVFFLVFLVYSLYYSRHPKFVAPAGIVVLGSGLIRGEAPPLLQRRIDRGIAIWRSTPGAVLIPSGGQGDDEPRAESEAMAEYMIKQGVPPAAIVQENRSRNTRENLLYSREVLDAHAGSGSRGTLTETEGQMLAVTSNYHVLRAALLARDIGSAAEVVGAPTASYYVPSAFLREFAAVVVRHRWLNIVLLLPFVALAVMVVVAFYAGQV